MQSERTAVDLSKRYSPSRTPQATHAWETGGRGTGAHALRLLIASLLLALLWTVALPLQAWADTFYVTRGQSLDDIDSDATANRTMLFTWDDATSTETPIAFNT